MSDILKSFKKEEKQGALSYDEIQIDSEEDIQTLRPQKFSEYIGQKKVIEALKIAIEAAKIRDEAIEHILFYGPPGLGKTSLAYIVANETGARIHTTSGPSLEKAGDLIGLLSKLSDKDILFIDEIHRTPKIIEEFLYSAMEDFAVDFIFDKGIHARSHRFKLNKFVLIGATTRAGLLSAPLRDRFGIFRNLNFYSSQELLSIIKRSALILNVKIDNDAALELAKKSRGTPRIANRLLKRVRDYSLVKKKQIVDCAIVNQALELEGINNLGLSKLDQDYIKTIMQYYNGGPVGIEAIAAALQEEAETLIDIVEPYLLKEGFILRTPAGRKVNQDFYKNFEL